MEPAFTPAPHAASHYLSASEQAELRAAGVSMDLISRLIRAFVASLLSELPGILGGGTPAQSPVSPPKMP